MANLRILHVIHTLRYGGAQRYVADLVTAPTDGIEWMVVGLGPPDTLVAELHAKGVRIARTLSSTPRDPTLPAKLRDLIRSENVHIIHAHGSMSPFWATLALRKLDLPLIVGINSEPAKARWLSRRFLRPIGLKRADAVVCAAHAIRDQLIRLYPYAGPKSTVIYNCVDRNRLRITKHREQVRRELKIPINAPVICNVANIWWVKGQIYLVRAMAQVIRQIPDAVAIVAGAVTEEKVAEQLRKAIDELGLRDRFLFLGCRSDVPDLLAASDLFVLSSVTECLPVSIIEAMMLGTPVVATDVGGVRELVIDGRTGFVVPPRDPDALAAAIIRVLSSSELAAEFSREALAHIENIAAVEPVRAAHIDLYRRILAGQPLLTTAPV